MPIPPIMLWLWGILAFLTLIGLLLEDNQLIGWCGLLMYLMTVVIWIIRFVL